MNTDIIKINISEVASELAELHLIRDYTELNKNKTEDEIEAMIWVEDEGEVLIYTEHAQNHFNILYDLYYSLLENLAL